MQKLRGDGRRSAPGGRAWPGAVGDREKGTRTVAPRPGRHLVRRALARALPGLLAAALPVAVSAHLQCVPYARAVSGIAIHGDAGLWWDKAAGRYARGRAPAVGAVLAFRPTAAMPRGHVAVVARIVDARHLMLDHANWSGPGRIERQALVEDVSPAGDWSAVRVWHAPSGTLGARENPTFGFIYGTGADTPDGDEAPRFVDTAGGAGKLSAENRAESAPS